MCQDVGQVWVFGYGSILWRPGFPYERKVNGYIKGYKRRFWQRCRFHRGTDDRPGRVVTIIQSKREEQGQRIEEREGHEEEEDIVHGTCYCISNEVSQQVLAQLDFREQGGYVRMTVPVYIKVNGVETPILSSYLYCGGQPGSDDYIDESCAEERAEEDIARVIATSRGPSGPNVDYLFNLARVLREELCVQDNHIFKLEHLVREMLRKGSDVPRTVTATAAVATSKTTTTAGMQTTRMTATLVTENEAKTQKTCSIVVDDGTVQMISCGKAKGVLPVGVVSVNGPFSPQDEVLVRDRLGKPIACGKANYSSEQVEQLKGRHSKYISKVIPTVDNTALREHRNLCYVVPTEKLF